MRINVGLESVIFLDIENRRKKLEKLSMEQIWILIKKVSKEVFELFEPYSLHSSWLLFVC
jgi:hypothetical protein